MDRQTIQARAKSAAVDLAAMFDVDERPLAMHLEVFGGRLLAEVRGDLACALERTLSEVSAIGERGPDLRLKRVTEQLLRDAAERRLADIEAQLARARETPVL